jgi:hypothetical protein
MDYAPDTTDTPSFTGIAIGSEQVYDNHGKKPRRCVAFQGVDTCQRFYMCSIENVSSVPTSSLVVHFCSFEIMQWAKL